MLGKVEIGEHYAGQENCSYNNSIIQAECLFEHDKVYGGRLMRNITIGGKTYHSCNEDVRKYIPFKVEGGCCYQHEFERAMFKILYNK